MLLFVETPGRCGFNLFKTIDNAVALLYSRGGAGFLDT